MSTLYAQAPGSTHGQVTLSSFAKFLCILVTYGARDMLKPLVVSKAENIEVRQNEIRVWFVGHSTVLINFFGTTILTDPVLVNWIPFPRRIVAAAYAVKDFPKVDFILLSHSHLDHLNRASLRALASKTSMLIVPDNCSDLVLDLGVSGVRELGWDEQITIGDIRIKAFQTVHWGRRYPWEKKDRGYNAYLIEKNCRSVYFGGDTAYGPYFRAIGDAHDIDVAVLSIGSYNPRQFRNEHMDPADALQAFKDLGASAFVPIHWGSFRLSREPFREPPELLIKLAAEDLLSDKIHILENGQSYTYAHTDR